MQRRCSPHGCCANPNAAASHRASTATCSATGRARYGSSPTNTGRGTGPFAAVKLRDTPAPGGHEESPFGRVPLRASAAGVGGGHVGCRGVVGAGDDVLQPPVRRDGSRKLDLGVLLGRSLANALGHGRDPAERDVPNRRFGTGMQSGSAGSPSMRGRARERRRSPPSARPTGSGRAFRVNAKPGRTSGDGAGWRETSAPGSLEVALETGCVHRGRTAHAVTWRHGGMQAWWTRVRRAPIVHGTGPSGPVSEVEPGHAGADGTPAPDGDGNRTNG